LQYAPCGEPGNLAEPRARSHALAEAAAAAYFACMKFTVTIDRDETGVWVAECPAIPGCVSQGHTKPEALKNIREAIQLCLEVRAERGLPLTIETKQVEVAV
jgi:predicted RNase H-like HicB family nuclease